MRKRPLSVYKKLLHVVNEQDACHLGEPEYDTLAEYDEDMEKPGPEPPHIAAAGELEGKGFGRFTQGVAMEHLAHVIFGHYNLDMDYPDMKFICNNFYPVQTCPGSPCDPTKDRPRQ